MNKLTLRVSAVVGLLITSAFSAFSASDYVLRVHVPFAFTVGQTAMPAGDYIVNQDSTSGIVMMQNRAAKSSAAVISTNGGVGLEGKSPELIFQRLNGRTVLTQIQMSGSPSRMMPASLNTPVLR